MEGKGDNPISF